MVVTNWLTDKRSYTLTSIKSEYGQNTLFASQTTSNFDPVPTATGLPQEQDPTILDRESV